ncbi:MAG: hypothetical protein IM526_02410 [Microcystis sp. M38BS1]|uniref:hypothetical protein n=1 Tax=Microcystis sp. M38BS1 TaxID=2771188 RepID=UPI0031FD168D|nr:hypothetical protein [Microcystis sp. M38BS1]MCA6582510.1 hypothetical protein [Pseudanabaena sp. M34BS1SP1A06MG]
MAPLFSAIGSGEIKKLYGRVISTKQASGKFSAYTDISVSVEQRAKEEGEQYAPSLIVTALTLDDSIEKGDKVIIEGVLKTREYNDKTYYQMSPFVILPVTVVEKAGQQGQAPAAKTVTKSAAPAQDDLDEDF